jgi:hypothetical protein
VLNMLLINSYVQKFFQNCVQKHGFIRKVVNIVLPKLKRFKNRMTNGHWPYLYLYEWKTKFTTKLFNILKFNYLSRTDVSLLILIFVAISFQNGKHLRKMEIYWENAATFFLEAELKFSGKILEVSEFTENCLKCILNNFEISSSNRVDYPP